MRKTKEYGGKIMAFIFEKLVVYQKSLLFVEKTECLAGELKGKVSYSMLDQLQRRVLSAALNIAEINDRFHKKAKVKFSYISRGSMFECVPILQVMRSKSILSKNDYDGLYSDLENMSKMISGLINSYDKTN
ncbi:MAG: four helix bundle protein [bacterium]|nr:four helix bundle protein [bacterium]